MIEELSFLEEGKFTRRDELVKRIAEELRTSPRYPWGAVSGFVSGLEYNEDMKNSEFRKRTASEIINSGYVVGCSDAAVVFLALSRELGIPSRYVEAFEQKWLKNPLTNKINEHVFVDIFVNGKWWTYEPINGFIHDNAYKHIGNEYSVVGKGLDFSEVYILDNGVYLPEPVQLQDYESIRRQKERLNPMFRQVRQAGLVR